MRNNIILNCSHDVGIYLNRSKNTEIYNNLVFNSLGIDLQYSTSTATIYNNILSGRIKTRNGAKYSAQNNLIDQDCIAPNRQFSSCSFIDWYWDIINADLEIRKIEKKIIGTGINSPLAKDFCENLKQINKTDIGPIQYSNNLACSPDKMN
jgi:parallel beta-helix repeat protein